MSIKKYTKSDYVIFIDGSHIKHRTNSHNRLGIGGLLLDSEENILDQFSEEITREYMKYEFDADDCSNPTMEMLAALFALRNFHPFMPDRSRVTIYADYMGVSKWMRGEWKAKAPYIVKIIEKVREIQKQRKLKIKWEWVKGHQGGENILSHFNELTDLLARGGKANYERHDLVTDLRRRDKRRRLL